MRISPAVMFSSPAIMRSSVDLPQPDGPTNTTNSPSLMLTDTPWMTAVEPNDLRTSRMTTDAMDFLPGGSMAALYVPALYGLCQSPYRSAAGLNTVFPLAKSLKSHAAIDQVGLAGDVARLIGRKEYGEIGDF